MLEYYEYFSITVLQKFNDCGLTCEYYNITLLQNSTQVQYALEYVLENVLQYRYVHSNVQNANRTMVASSASNTCRRLGRSIDMKNCGGPLVANHFLRLRCLFDLRVCLDRRRLFSHHERFALDSRAIVGCGGDVQAFRVHLCCDHP